MLRYAVFSGRNVFLVAKTLNLIIVTANSFVLVYVLIRTLTLDLYPTAVLISSLGTYIMATDLGYSGFVYFRTRQSFLNDAKPHGSEAEVFLLYTAISLCAFVVTAIAIELFLAVAPMMRAALSLYFLSIVLALPWNLLRRITAAVDLYLSFEIYEVMRRLFFLVLALSMLVGVPFIVFVVVCLAAWFVAFFIAIRILRAKRGMSLLATSPSLIVAHMRENSRNIWQSGSLTVLEFAIYNFPYLMIPVVYTDKTLIVTFDIFYKIIRFGAVSYAVPAESFLPAQTRAFYAKDRRGVLRYYGVVLLLGLIPFGLALLMILGFGDKIFTALLSRSGLIDPSLRVAMVIMLAAMLLKESAGIFLFGTGNYGRLSPLALFTLILMACVTGVTWWMHLSFHNFMYLYVIAYCGHAALYTIYLLRFTRSMKREA